MTLVSDRYLVVEALTTHFPLRRRRNGGRGEVYVRAVDEVSLWVARGEVLGLVGESGCGKSTLARSIMQLVPVTSGRVALAGRTLTSLSRRALRAARVEFQMIFQDPYSSLNPRMTVFDTLAEALRRRQALRGAALRGAVVDWLERVGLSASDMRKYPHEFSGGQRQRIAVARALAPAPNLVIADEPVSALDVSVQSQIINLIQRLCTDVGLTLVLISHDLSVVKHISDRIAVMYAGRLVEVGPAAAVVEAPLHPYTRALVSAMPLPDPDAEWSRKRLVLRGEPPSPIAPPPGCRFAPRCPYAEAACAAAVPDLVDTVTGRSVACRRLRNGVLQV